MVKNPFWTGETYQIVKAMKATGNQAGVIQSWKDIVDLWAIANRTSPDAQAVLTWLPYWQARPFYSVDELTPVFPVLAAMLGITEKPSVQKSVGRLHHELEYAGLPSRTIHGRKYFIVERLHHWRNAPIEACEKEFNYGPR